MKSASSPSEESLSYGAMLPAVVRELDELQTERAPSTEFLSILDDPSNGSRRIRSGGVGVQRYIR